MASFSENLVLRDLIKLQQEMVSLKAPQRYLTGQTKGYKSNTLRVDSQVAWTRGGFTWREIFCELQFLGDRADKTVIPTLKFQLYNSQGQPINTQAGITNNQLALYGIGSRAGDTPNDHRFVLLIYIVSDSTPDAFYANFWCVANDSGIISLKERFVTP